MGFIPIHFVIAFLSFSFAKFKVSVGKFKITALLLLIRYSGNFHCRFRILEEFSDDLTTDLFILSSHFNSLLDNGVVMINVDDQFVEYHLKRDLLVPLLYDGEINNQLRLHYELAKDIYAAFQRVVDEREAPAIIIADLLRNKNNV